MAGPGAVLALGTSSGEVVLLDARTLQPLVQWRMAGGEGVLCVQSLFVHACAMAGELFSVCARMHSPSTVS